MDASSSFSVADLVPRLVSEFGYGEGAARLVAEDLVNSDPRIRTAFWHWWQTGDLSTSPEIEGYTAERLIQDHGLNPVGAFATLSGLQTDRDLVLDTLRRGFDRLE
jgi:hypothetical protein